MWHSVAIIRLHIFTTQHAMSELLAGNSQQVSAGYSGTLSLLRTLPYDVSCCFRLWVGVGGGGGGGGRGGHEIVSFAVRFMFAWE